MYPVTIVDNFFPEPDKIVDYASTLTYDSSSLDLGSWPGSRTDILVNINEELFNYVGDKIINLFYPQGNLQWNFDIRFQLIQPFHENQYHPKNKGWIHMDKNPIFGGVIFLNKNPERDTGTSIYRTKNGYYQFHDESNIVKGRFYSGEEVPDEEYIPAYNRVADQFEETMRIENVYNRMLLFNNTTLHGVQTFGKKQSRLTLPFFCFGLNSEPQPTPPMCRRL